MIKLSITGKADKRIITYPLMRACSIAGRTYVITDDAAYKRLYSGKENHGEIEGIKITVLPTMSSEYIAKIEEQAVKDEIEYLIYISDSFHAMDAERILMLCENNRTFFGDSIEDIIDEYDNVSFATLSLTSTKNKPVGLSNTQIHQIIWKPEYSLYLFKVEELRRLLPLKDKAVSALLISSFSDSLNIKPDSFHELLKERDMLLHNLTIERKSDNEYISYITSCPWKWEYYCCCTFSIRIIIKK